MLLFKVNYWTYINFFNSPDDLFVGYFNPGIYIICPSCRKRTCEETFEDLADDFRLKAFLAASKKSKFPPAQKPSFKLCSICPKTEETVNAERWCIECKVSNSILIFYTQPFINFGNLFIPYLLNSTTELIVNPLEFGYPA